MTKYHVAPEPATDPRRAERMTENANITAALEEFAGRDKAAWDVRGDHGCLLLALDAAKDDMPRALAALENVMELAAKLLSQGAPSSALEEDRMWIRQECADMIREAVSAALFAED